MSVKISMLIEDVKQAIKIMENKIDVDLEKVKLASIKFYVLEKKQFEKKQSVLNSSRLRGLRLPATVLKQVELEDVKEENIDNIFLYPIKNLENEKENILKILKITDSKKIPYCEENKMIISWIDFEYGKAALNDIEKLAKLVKEIQEKSEQLEEEDLEENEDQADELIRLSEKFNKLLTK